MKANRVVNRQSSIVNRQSSIALAAGLVIAASGLSAQAASADPLEYEKLVKEARTTGLVPVVVDLELLSLADISKHGKALGARMNQRTTQLLAELGTHAVADSAWGNGVGQFEVHVTEQGLQLLRGSGNAQAFRAGKAWSARTALAGFDGRFGAIQAALNRDGFVDVEVVTNVDGMEFDLPSHGRAVVSPSTHRAAMTKAGDLLASLSDRHAHNLPSAAAQIASAGATQSTVQPLSAGADAAWPASTILAARRQLSWPVEAGKFVDELRVLTGSFLVSFSTAVWQAKRVRP